MHFAIVFTVLYATVRTCFACICSSYEYVHYVDTYCVQKAHPCISQAHFLVISPHFLRRTSIPPLLGTVLYCTSTQSESACNVNVRFLSLISKKERRLLVPPCRAHTLLFHNSQTNEAWRYEEEKEGSLVSDLAHACWERKRKEGRKLPLTCFE